MYPNYILGKNILNSLEINQTPFVIEIKEDNLTGDI
jgi:hypothetical protein